VRWIGSRRNYSGLFNDKAVEKGELSMSVTVRIPSALRKLTGGQAELSVEGATVKELLGDIGQQHPALLARITGENGELRQFLNVFVNGTDIRFEQELATAVKSGDEVSIVPSIAGGTNASEDRWS
jgi:molybdopterin synthase sulfur carrier subunit